MSQSVTPIATAGRVRSAVRVPFQVLVLTVACVALSASARAAGGQQGAAQPRPAASRADGPPAQPGVQPGVQAASQPAAPGEAVAPDSPDATRDQLGALLVDAQRRAGDASLKPADRTRAQGDVATLRRRLEQGDFQPGDRFFMTVIADSVRRGEVTVREGPEIEFGALPPLSLAGVLRSELQSAIHRHLSRYFRSPEVRVQHMLRLTVSGAVGRPGSHAVAPDALIADVVTVVAGGFAPGAKMDRITVLRGNREIVSRKDYQRAVQSGRTVESLGLRAGDEIRVDMREQRRNWAQIATVGAFAISILISLLALIRSSYAD